MRLRLGSSTKGSQHGDGQLGEPDTAASSGPLADRGVRFECWESWKERKRLKRPELNVRMEIAEQLQRFRWSEDMER